MSTDKSAESIKNLTESHTESDKIQSTASNETTSPSTIKPVELDEGDNKKGNKTFFQLIILSLILIASLTCNGFSKLES
jgi:hypothetical protein